MQVFAISTQDAVESLVPEWQRLHQEVESPFPYNHPRWILSWWRCRREIGLVWACYAGRDEDGRLSGVLPLVRYRDGTIRFAGHDLHDVASAVVSDHQRGELWRAAIHDIQRTHVADPLDLPTLSDRDLAALRATTTYDQLSIYEMDPGAFIELPHNWEDYWQTLSAQRRKHMRAERRALERDCGSARFEIVSAENEISLAVDEFWALRETSWQARGRYGDLADHARGPSLRSFLIDLASRDIGSSMLAVGRLAVPKQTIGSALLLRAENRYWYSMCTFAAEFARYGPGRLLLAECVRAAIAAGLSRLELGRGVEEYKFALGAMRYELANVRISLNPPRSR